MTKYVIYIPGLGDSRPVAQRFIIKFWRLWGVEPQLFQMNWASDEALAPKFERLLKLIDEIAAKGSVSLVAASAGATAAINAYAVRQDKISGVVCICGKINNPGGIGEHYKRRNPAFWESAQLTPGSLAKLDSAKHQRILSIRAMFDPVIPAADSTIAGAYNRVTWTSGHSITIVAQIIFGAPLFLRFLKRLDK